MLINLIETIYILRYLIPDETRLSFNLRPLTKDGIFREPEC
jgi:hypothetical protein